MIAEIISFIARAALASVIVGSVKLERTTNDTGNIIADRKTWTCNRRWRK